MNQAASVHFPALQAAGVQAGHIARLWWVFFVVLAAVYLLVLLALVAAVVRRRARPADQTAEEGPIRVVSAAVALTVLVLLGLFGGSVATGRVLGALGETAGAPLIVKVIGHQWWWEIQYQNQDVSQMVTTANELHLPVGHPVQLELQSRDVIHSFWVPVLHGKRDLIPGYTNVITVRADQPGLYAGRCAEFCGLQHANMSLTVVAEPPATFQAWLAAQRAPAAAPATAAARHGREVFLQSACPLCHTVAGTRAFGMVAPDLTHVGSRRTLAAGALRNDQTGTLGGFLGPPATTPLGEAQLRQREAGPLERWLTDPQAIKPGSHMPIVALRPQDRRDLVAFLEGLK